VLLLVAGTITNVVCNARTSERTGNGKHIDVTLPGSPAVLATNVSNADRVSVLHKLWIEYVDIMV